MFITPCFPRVDAISSSVANAYFLLLITPFEVLSFCFLYVFCLPPAVYLDEKVTIPCFLNSFRTSLCIDYFFYEWRREFGLADILQRLNNDGSGKVYCLIPRVWFWQVSFSFLFEEAIYVVYFSLVLRSTTHHGVQFVLGMNQGVNPFALVGTRIRNQYTRVEGRFPSHCQFQVLSIGRIPILSKQLTLSHRFRAPNR